MAPSDAAVPPESAAELLQVCALHQVEATDLGCFTDSGRLRTQLDVNLRWELINDLFWDLNYYNTYDSDPPSGAESTSDYGIVTSIGWSF